MSITPKLATSRSGTRSAGRDRTPSTVTHDNCEAGQPKPDWMAGGPHAKNRALGPCRARFSCSPRSWRQVLVAAGWLAGRDPTDTRCELLGELSLKARVVWPSAVVLGADSVRPGRVALVTSTLPRPASHGPRGRGRTSTPRQVIHALGEKEAAETLTEAAGLLEAHPAGLQQAAADHDRGGSRTAFDAHLPAADGIATGDGSNRSLSFSIPGRPLPADQCKP